MTPEHIDLDATTACPVRPACERCGSPTGVGVVTVALAPIGVACLTLCPICEPPPGLRIGVAYQRVGQHCEHLGIDVDQMGAALAAEDQEVTR